MRKPGYLHGGNLLLNNDPTPFRIAGNGYLYNYYLLTDVRNISSDAAWRVPNDADVDILRVLCGGPPDYFISSFDGGGKLKSTIEINDTPYSSGWTKDNIGATDEFKLSVLGSGRVANNGTQTVYGLRGSIASSLLVDGNSWMVVYLYNNSNTFLNFPALRHGGYSCRLVRDLEPSEVLLPDGESLPTYTGNDGKIYPVVKVGAGAWLQDNLAETKFRNNDDMVKVTNEADWNQRSSTDFLPTYAAPNYDDNYV